MSDDCDWPVHTTISSYVFLATSSAAIFQIDWKKTPAASTSINAGNGIDHLHRLYLESTQKHKLCRIHGNVFVSEG